LKERISQCRAWEIEEMPAESAICGTVGTYRLEDVELRAGLHTHHRHRHGRNACRKSYSLQCRGRGEETSIQKSRPKWDLKLLFLMLSYLLAARQISHISRKFVHAHMHVFILFRREDPSHDAISPSQTPGAGWDMQWRFVPL
jgi:hypothetical protein